LVSCERFNSKLTIHQSPLTTADPPTRRPADSAKAGFRCCTPQPADLELPELMERNKW
jgi:hypothetical protein